MWVAVLGFLIIAAWLYTFDFNGFDLHPVQEFFTSSRQEYDRNREQIFDDRGLDMFQKVEVAATSSETATPTEMQAQEPIVP